MQIAGVEFDQVWFVDFEFSQPAGERPVPVCLVAHELGSGRTLRLFDEELRNRDQPPYAVSANALFVAYYASAEMSCHLALGWPMPERVLDLFTEFRDLTNGLPTPSGDGLLGALAYFGLDAIEAVEKDTMRELAIRGGPYTNEERQALLAYCESDVIALRKLFEKMLPKLDLPRAVLRGRYMKAAARIERAGVPIDIESLATLRDKWDSIQDQLIARVDSEYGVFDGRTFKGDRFADYLIQHDIPWPRLDSGNLALDDDTFKDMARVYPQLEPLREVRVSLSQMRLADLAVGKDGHNRCMLSAFRARTGRNQPSNTKFIFGPAVWLRSLIQPAAGFGVAYIDWSQQEFGIAAALSTDEVMMEAYRSGDPYLAFAKQAGAVPPDATKRSHGAIRDQFKACALAVQYGMGEQSLAIRIGQPRAQARELLRLHHETYRTYWRWNDAALDRAMLHGSLPTVFGWTLHVVGPNPNPRSIRNFPMQANGAEMLRLACSLATERGITICAPVHDAVLIEAPVDELPAAVQATQDAMEEASRIVLGGFQLRADSKLIVHPDRYMDERGQKMWATVWTIIREMERGVA
jgi:hypothetical protein